MIRTHERRLAVLALALAGGWLAWAGGWPRPAASWPRPEVSAQTPSNAGRASTLRGEAFEFAYNLDYPETRARLEAALAAAPDDPATVRAMASAAWLEILFRRGSVLAEDYIGQLRSDTIELPPPPKDLAEEFMRDAQRAVALARARLETSPRDPGALYDLGAAEGLVASYTATVEGRIFPAFRAARRAYTTHERLLRIAPSRHDAGLIVGMYRYVVASLSMPVRWLAYLAGFGGNRDRALAYLHQASRFESDAQADARFALVLVYNREGRYDDALAELAWLRERFPRNRLLWLETAATAMRAGRHALALRFADEGWERTSRDGRPKIPGEASRWHYRRAQARISVGRDAEAPRLLDLAEQAAVRGWMRGRVLIERGRLAERRGAAAEARRLYEQARRLCERDNDQAGEIESQRMIDALRKK
ncbi:MAG: hypothetical protein KJ061_06340 [Vicinamibacteraceae bacterium]|nr:hypothetical protein [Vicinamibacteraceae bacterium]